MAGAGARFLVVGWLLAAPVAAGIGASAQSGASVTPAIDALAWLEEAIKADSASRSGVTALEAMATALTALGDTVGGTLVQAVAERYKAALPDSGSAAR